MIKERSPKRCCLDPITPAVLVLLALPLTLALLTAVIYFLARRWQGEAEQAEEETARFLADVRREFSGLRGVQAEYSGLHRQPYTQLAEELAGLVEEIEHETDELELGLSLIHI